MRVLTYDELPSAMDLDRALIHLAAFGGVFTARAVDLLRRRLKSLAEYVGVFAVERGRIVGQVFVHRLPYAFREGAGMISGIAAVGTRPDKGRSGIARRLLTEVHRREHEAGVEYAALWTNRSWGAHALYDQLGYRDVYSSPWVVHAPRATAGRKVRTLEIRPGRTTDLAVIDRFHDRQSAARLGFYRRPRGFSQVEARVGGLDPEKNLIVARRGPALVGYAHLDRYPWRVICGELMGASSEIRRALIHEVIRTAHGLHFVFQHTLVSDTPQLFRAHGYATVPQGWYGMMGAALARKWGTREAIRQFATDYPRLICMAGDRF